jgi:hypothetical protein
MTKKKDKTLQQPLPLVNSNGPGRTKIKKNGNQSLFSDFAVKVKKRGFPK